MRKRTAIFPMAFIVLVMFGVSCDTVERDIATAPGRESSPAPTPEPSQSQTLPPGATAGLADGATHRVADILGAPHSMSGKTVTVVAIVDDVYGPRAFKLVGLNGPGGPDRSEKNATHAGGVDKGLLALIPKVGGFPNADDQWKQSKARITGVVERMVVKDVEREIGWDLAPNLESEFKGKPVLIARAVERLSR